LPKIVENNWFKVSALVRLPCTQFRQNLFMDSVSDTGPTTDGQTGKDTSKKKKKKKYADMRKI
jgi:hypothetical protein